MLLVARFLLWLAALGALVVACLPATFALPAEPDDKLQHIAAFAVLSALAACAHPRARLTTLLLALALFGGLIEIVQSIPVVGRDADVFDWGADIAASAVTLVFMSDLRPLIVPGSADRANGEGQRGWFELALVVILLLALAGTGALLFRQTQVAQMAAPLLAPTNKLADQPETPTDWGNAAAVAVLTEPGGDGLAPQASPSATPPKAPLPRSTAVTQAATSASKPAGPKLPPGARETVMPVTVGGAAKGSLRLAVDQTSLIYADSGQLAALLPSQAAILKDLGPGYVSLISLRRAGIDLRYDRKGDSIEIAPK